MGKFSRDKGKRGEREVVNLLKENGFNVRRTSQYCGNTGDASDVVGLPGYHIEVKFVEKLNVDKAYEQAKNDSDAKREKTGERVEPIVVYRKSRTPWKVVLSLEKFLELIK